jgi:hypothetical protein
MSVKVPTTYFFCPSYLNLLLDYVNLLYLVTIVSKGDEGRESPFIMRFSEMEHCAPIAPSLQNSYPFPSLARNPTPSWFVYYGYYLDWREGNYV